MMTMAAPRRRTVAAMTAPIVRLRLWPGSMDVRLSSPHVPLSSKSPLSPLRLCYASTRTKVSLHPKLSLLSLAPPSHHPQHNSPQLAHETAHDFPLKKPCPWLQVIDARP